MTAGDPDRGLLATAEARAGRLGGGIYALLLCLATLALIGLVGLLTRQPLLFPSLGPTAMLFFERPLQAAAAPRNTLFGHGVAIAAGWVSLLLFGLLAAPPVLQEGITPARIGAAAVSVGLTALVLKLLDAPHPPAGATTLIVSLGLLTSPPELLAIAGGVVALTLASVVLNRSLGLRHPWWR